MNLKYLSLIFFILVVLSGAQYPLITIKNSDSEQTLDSAPGEGTIYIDLKSFSSGDTVYFLIKTDSGSIYNYIYVGYANGNGSDSTTPLRKEPSVTVTTQTNSESKQAYYYSLDYKNYDYMVINYYGFQHWNGGKLVVQCSNKNLAADLIKLILIIVFSVVGFVIIIVIVVVIILCLRKKKTVGFVGGINNVSPIAPQDPLLNNNQQYASPYPQPNLYQPS